MSLIMILKKTSALSNFSFLAFIVLFCQYSLTAQIPQTTKPETPTTSSKSKTDKGKLQAKKIMEQFIDGVFEQRKVVETFERLTLFEACDKVDEDWELECSFKEQTTKFGHTINSKIAALLWQSEFGDIFYILGTDPIPKDSDAYPYSSAEFDAIRTEVFKKNKFSEGFQGKGNTREIEQRLIQIETNYDEIKDIVFQRIDKSLYDINIKQMKNSITVEKFIIKTRVYYVVEIKGSILNYILAVRRGNMRIIDFADGL
jgi:hypothetical protein